MLSPAAHFDIFDRRCKTQVSTGFSFYTGETGQIFSSDYLTVFVYLHYGTAFSTVHEIATRNRPEMASANIPLVVRKKDANIKAMFRFRIRLV